MTSPSLKDALGIQRGDRVALIGAGGKTSCMERLGQEAAGQGWSVLLTTTTKIWPPVNGTLALASDGQAMRMPRAGELVTAGRCMGPEGKVWGFDADHVDRLAATSLDLLVCEADGAAGRALKVHAAHEPVVPGCVTRVVIVAGLDALGNPGAQVVHRSELFQAAAGQSPRSLVTAEVMARVIAGAVRCVPSGAHVTIVLNKADNPSLICVAQEVIQELVCLVPDIRVLVTCRGVPVAAMRRGGAA